MYSLYSPILGILVRPQTSDTIVFMNVVFVCFQSFQACPHPSIYHHSLLHEPQGKKVNFSHYELRESRSWIESQPLQGSYQKP